MKLRIVNAPVLVGLVAFTALSLPPSRASADPPPPPPATAAPVAPSPVPPEPSVKRSTVALYAAGLAVIGAGVGAVFGGLALKNKKEYESGPTYSNSDNGNNDAAYADGGFALAVAAGVTSLVLYLTRDAAYVADPTAAVSKKPGASVSASPLVAPHGGGASAVLTF